MNISINNNKMVTEKVNIPQGQTIEDVKTRKKFIMDFYAQWNASNPAKLKLTVGVLRGSKKHIQYCITAIEKTTTQNPRVPAIV
jgi:hypothetical protein